MDPIKGPTRRLRTGKNLVVAYGHTYGGTPTSPDVYAELRLRIGTGDTTMVRLADAPKPFESEEEARRWLHLELAALPIGTFFGEEQTEGHVEPEELCGLCQEAN